MTLSQFLIITKQLHTCVVTFQKQKGFKEAKDTFNRGVSDYEKIAIARAYTTKRECSVQKAVYLIMSEKKTFPNYVPK